MALAQKTWDKILESELNLFGINGNCFNLDDWRFGRRICV